MPSQKSGLLMSIVLVLGGIIAGLIVVVGLFQWETTTRADSALAEATPTMSVQISKEKNGTAPAPPAADAASGGAEAGKAIFTTNCNGCHPSGGAGVGPALKGVPADLFKQVTRQGRGAMPPYPASRISDQQLDDILAFLK